MTAERFTGRHITLPILSHLLFKVDDRKISIMATNLEIGIEYTFPGKVQKAGIITTPAKPLAQLLQSVKDEHITLEAKQHQLLLHTTSSDITLLGLNPADFPTLPAIKKEHSCVIPVIDFTSALQQVLPAAATSNLKPELSGVFFAAHPGTLTLAATDSFRLSEKTINQCKGIKEPMECIVPARVLQEVLRTIPTGNNNEVEVGVGEHQVIFEWNNIRILSRLIDGAYPPYKNIIPKSYETTLAVNREDLLQKIRLAAVFSSRLNDVAIRFSLTELEVATANTETGSTTARLPAKGRGAAGSSVFNYRYLLDGVEAADGENVVLNINGVSGPTLIQNPSDSSYLYLLMPIRSV